MAVVQRAQLHAFVGNEEFGMFNLSRVRLDDPLKYLRVSKASLKHAHGGVHQMTDEMIEREEKQWRALSGTHQSYELNQLA